MGVQIQIEKGWYAILSMKHSVHLEVIYERRDYRSLLSFVSFLNTTTNMTSSFIVGTPCT